MLGDWLIGLIIGGFLFLYFVVKVARAVDDDGQIGKTTGEGIASCIERLFK